MVSDGAGDDRSEEWRRAYRSVRKDPIGSSSATNRRRLATLGFVGPGLGGRWLDLGAGDGNLAVDVRELGVEEVVALDYQHTLLRSGRHGATSVTGSAVELPFARDSFDVVVAMDLLHHLVPADLVPALVEARRVLAPGGVMAVVEPADTWVRRFLTPLLMSPLAGLSRFSRDKRMMVELEAATLVPWLRGEREVTATYRRCGFRVDRVRRGPLHVAVRLTAR